MSDEKASTTGVETETQTEVVPDTLLTATDSDTTTDKVVVDDTGEDGKTDTPGDTDVSSQTAPDAYADFVMPEGVEVDAALITEATPLFKELGLTQDQAQKLVDFQAKQAQASSEGRVDAFNQLMKDWSEKSKNDSEFGGDKFEENVGIARSAIDKFGTPELKQLLEEHGVGNHPEVIRFMIKVGKMTAEDVPGGTVTPTSKAQDRVSLMYPNENN